MPTKPRGCLKPHVIARRGTADGKHLLLWDDGSLTWALGYSVKGSANPKTAEQRALALKAGRLVLGEACLFDAEEVPALVSAARWVAARSGLPGDVRARFRKQAEPKGPQPHWTVLETDRDGAPTLRVWRLPRLAWPGLAVWNERGRYEVMREIGRSGTFEPTGFRAATLAEIRTILEALRSAEVS